MKLKLDTSAMVEDFFDDARILGIVAPLPDYRFIWHINKILGHKFRVNHGSEVKLIKKKREYFFSVFEYQMPSCSLCYYLYNNQDDGEYLLPEFKNLDFLWLTKGDIVTDEELNILQQCLRSIPSVQLVTEMSSDKIKNKDYLII